MMMARIAKNELVDAGRLRRWAHEVFERTGMATDDAAIASDAHVWADLRGASAQGVVKLLQYLPRVRSGVTRADARVETLYESAGFAVLDAQQGWGPVAAMRTMQAAISNAPRAGVSAAVVRNTSTACALGQYSARAASAGFIGLTINNSQPLQPAWGGITKVLGNQAFALACPGGSSGHILLDTATTAITLNKIEGLRDNGEPMPAGVALNERGEPTVDHAEALAGLLLPMGGHRGYGLALMWEILTGVLAGGSTFGASVNGLNTLDRPSGVSIFCLAIDPTIYIQYDRFLERVDRLVDRVHANSPAAGVDRVLVPGERSSQMAVDREREGIPIPVERIAKLRALGDEVGVAW